MLRLLLALIVAGPGPVFAQSAPVRIRITTRLTPVSGAPGPAGSSAPRLGNSAPRLSAPVLTAPSVAATPGAPRVAVPGAESLPTPSILSPMSAGPVLPAAPGTDAPGDRQAPKTAFEGLQTELPTPNLEEGDLGGLSEHAGRSFEAKLGVEAAVPEAISAFTEGAYHPSAKVKTPEPEYSGDDGGGPTKSRKVGFNGKNFPSVAFRPNDPVEPLLAGAIDASMKSVQIILYEFTSRTILKSLLAAKKRGVKVSVVLCDSAVNPRNEPDADYKRYRSEQIWALIRNKVDVTVIGRPTKYGINHHKFAIFDGKMAEFGSYNWTYTSEQNHYENVLFTTDVDRVKAYQAAWKHLKAMSVGVEESATKEWPKDVTPPPSDKKKTVSFNGTKLPGWIFTPTEGFEDSIAAAIDASKKTVDAAAFVLESRKIADALDRALTRGVKVRVVADKSQAAYDHVQLFLGYLARRGANVRLLGGPNGEESDYPLAEKMHNKYFIFDGKLVETGSGNATKNAGINNFENANFLADKTDVAAFVKTFEHMFYQAVEAPSYPEGTLPTDQQMRENVFAPRGPPLPGEPAPAPLPAATRVAFNGLDFPASAFRPNEPIEAELIKAIDSAKKTLRVAMYEFNQQGFWDALQRANKRGVKIEVLLDRSHVYTTGYEDDGITPRMPKQMIVDLLRAKGYNVLLLKGRLGGIMHNKFLVVDDGLLQLGSYNYTHQSEADHFENVTFTTDKKRVEGALEYYKYMRSMGEKMDLKLLKKILARTDSAMPKADEAVAESSGRSKPAPAEFPQDKETPITLHGQKFARQLFSPNAGIEAALVRAIEASKATIEIAMFSFFSQPIAEALLRAKERGVGIRIVMDKSQSGTSKLDNWFAWHGFELRLLTGPDRTRDPRYQKMHNKFAIFDGAMLESGSFNYSSRAETLSYENASFYNDTEMIARFAAAFAQMFERGLAPKAPKREPVFTAPANSSDAVPEA